MSKTMSPLRKWQPGAPTIYFLVGPPASGKSTFVCKHMETVSTPTYVASTDDILERFAIEDGTSYAVAWSTRFKDAEKEFKIGIAEAARAGKDIVVDRTNVFPSARRKVMALVESNTGLVYIRRAIIFSEPDEVLKERLQMREAATGKHVPWEAIEKMMADYVEPSSEEFHFIKRI